MHMLHCAPARPSLPRQSILVVPLQIKNPTSAGEQRDVTDDAVVVERKETAAEPARGVTTRSRSRCFAAIALALPLPEEILVWEIFVRLPAKDILRCRMVCRTWRGLASTADFLLFHHRHQPSLPLLTLYHATSANGGLPIFEHSRSVLGFDDYDAFKIHASWDGLLLISLFGPRYIICNPTTRQYAPILCLNHYDIHIAALYLHCQCREYRALYMKEGHNYDLKSAYYILTVRPGSLPRRIGVPSDTPGSKKILLTFHESTTTFAPPIVFHDCLHWDPGCFRSNADIVVFDTVVESFRFMRSPNGATRFCTRLCDMEGSLGFTCFDHEKTVAKIWVLEDYERQVWSFKYHVKLPVDSLCSLEDTRHLVLSHNGDVLVYSSYKGYMFQCDNNGKLLEEFRCDPSSRLSIIGHWFKESLFKHYLFSRRDSAYSGQPSLFHG